jgi:hypothetical protein
MSPGLGLGGILPSLFALASIFSFLVRFRSAIITQSIGPHQITIFIDPLRIISKMGMVFVSSTTIAFG